MSDRIAVMNDGIVEHLGTPREIYECPATKFVAHFIGTTNLLTGTVSSVDGDTAVLALGSGQVVVALHGRTVALGEAVEVSVRPEKIGIAATPPSGDTTSVVRGVVTEVIYLGTSTNYNVAIPGGVTVVVYDQNVASASDVAARGDTVFLTWNPRHSYVIGA
jgi:spermidine/putrescine transport system ATP-binding protein